MATNKLDEAMIRALAAQHAPGMENAITALSLLESSKGQADAAYQPNKVGAIGPLQILSKQLGGKYGNFEQYSAADMKDPMNPVHSTVAGIRMFADLVNKHGMDGGVNAYFTGSPTPKPTRTDGLTTAANYLAKFKAAMTPEAGAGRGNVQPPMVNGILPGETGGMPTEVLRTANQSGGFATNPDGTVGSSGSLPPLATPGFNPAASQSAPGKFDVPALLQRAVDAIAGNAVDNRKSMGTYGMDDKDPNSAAVVGGRNSGDNIKAMAGVFDRSNGRFSGPTYDAQNPLERLASMWFGGARDQMDFNRINGQIQAMQGALGGQQKLAGGQQQLNNNATEDVTKIVGIAAQAEAREQATAAQLERTKLLAQQSQAKADATAGVDKLLQDAATKLGMTIPQGVKPSDYAKVLGPETLSVLQSVAAGGSIAANPVDAVRALSNPSLPTNLRESGAPLAAYVNAASQSKEFQAVLKGAKLEAMELEQAEAVRQQLLSQFVTTKLGDASKGGGVGFTDSKGGKIANPYDNYGGGLRAQMTTKGLPDPADNLTALNTLLKSNLPAAEVAAMYRSAIANNKYDLFGAPKQSGVFWQDKAINGGKALDLTLPQNIELLRNANIAAARAQQESPGLFDSLSDLFGTKPAGQPAQISDIVAP